MGGWRSMVGWWELLKAAVSWRSKRDDWGGGLWDGKHRCGSEDYFLHTSCSALGWACSWWKWIARQVRAKINTNIEKCGKISCSFHSSAHAEVIARRAKSPFHLKIRFTFIISQVLQVEGYLLLEMAFVLFCIQSNMIVKQGDSFFIERTTYLITIRRGWCHSKRFFLYDPSLWVQTVEQYCQKRDNYKDGYEFQKTAPTTPRSGRVLLQSVSVVCQ